MARIVDEASLACCKRVVVRREGAGSSFLGSPPAKRDSGETLAFPAAAGVCVAESSGARVPRATVAGSSLWEAARKTRQAKFVTFCGRRRVVRQHDAPLQQLMRRAAR